MASTAQMPRCNYIDLEQAVDGLVDRINQEDWSPARTTQHNLCLERIAALLPNGTLNKDTLPSTPSLATMQALLQDLDALIFRKSISARCDFVWDPQQVAKGLCQSPLNGRIAIKLNPARFDNWWEIVDTLLHELCHGWLYLHVCDASCGRGSPCKMIRKIGATGHGWSFMKIVHAVEGFAQKHLVTIRDEISLNRWQAAVVEYKASDPSMSDRCMMEFFAPWAQGLVESEVKR